MRIVHKGRGQTIVVEERPFTDTSADMPRRAQRLAGVAAYYARLPAASRPVRTGDAAYRPGPFLDIAADGCRFTIEGKTMCGAKARPGSAWCGHHHTIVYEKRGKAQ